jgi:hypothetical protein
LRSADETAPYEIAKSVYFYDFSMCVKLTLILLTTTIVAPPSNASKWQMGFNSAFKGLMIMDCDDNDDVEILHLWLFLLSVSPYFRDHLHLILLIKMGHPLTQMTGCVAILYF